VGGTRYCPQCRRSTGQWRNGWRLPWTTTCPDHACILRSACAECGLPPRAARTRASSRAIGFGDGVVCRNAILDGANICGARLDLHASETASPDQLRIDCSVGEAVYAQPSQVIGRELDAFQTLQAWRAAACLVSAFSGDPLDKWNAKRPWLSPPRSAQTMNRLLIKSQALVNAPDAVAAAEVLRALVPEDTARTGGWGRLLRDRTGRRSPLDPAIDAFAATRGRTSSRLRHSSQLALASSELRLEAIPQLAWACVLRQCLQPEFLCITLAALGYVSFPQFKQRHFHFAAEPGYASSGSNPTAKNLPITIALSSFFEPTLRQ